MSVVRPAVRRSEHFPLLIVVLAVACSDSSEAPDELACGNEDPAASVGVAGEYYYYSGTYALRGTITFDQEGSLVRVLDTTYENADDRALMGEAELVGNRLDIELVPKNGDTDYRATVAFLFGDPTPGFCVLGFNDTNGDYGGPRSYLGEPR
jgi:hypothetical protein